jgi:hypothetical protein
VDPFTLRDEDCWYCIAEELESTDPELAAELREALNDPRRNLPLSGLALFVTSYRVQLDMAAMGCRAQFRCSH